MRRVSFLLLALLLAGCGRGTARRAESALPRTLPLEVLADRAPDASLPPAHVEPTEEEPAPPARLVLLGVSPQRGGIAAPPAEATPAEPPAAAAPEPAREDDRLRPPLPRGGTTLRLAGARGRWVELDVRVDETGAVSDAELAGCDADAALVAATIAAVRATRWYPARQGGRAVAVWCRQRFELGR